MGFFGNGSVGKITESDLPITIKEKLVKVNEIGDLSELQTKNKSSLTAATNEVTTLLADTQNDLKVRTGVNIKLDFGAKGDGVVGDDEALNRALLFVNSSETVDKIFFPPGDYYFAKNVKNHSITKNIYLIGDNVRIFMKYDDNNSINSQYSILSLGISTLNITDPIPTDIKKGTRFINVTNTSKFKVGQLIEINSNENYSVRATPFSEYKKGYITTVQSVTNGQGITVADKSPYDFSAKNNLHCLIRNDSAYKGVNIEGISFEWVNAHLNTRTSPSTCVQIVNSANSYVKKCNFGDMNIGLQMFSGYNIYLDEIKIQSPDIPSVSSDYGLSFSSSHNVTIERVISNTANTSINFSGSPGINNKIKNSRLTSISGRPVSSHCCYDLLITDTTLNGKGYLELSGNSFIFENTSFNINDQMIIVNKEAKSFEYLKLKSCEVNYDFTSGASALVMFNGKAITKTSEIIFDEVVISGKKIEYLVWYNNINSNIGEIGDITIKNSTFENTVEYPVFWAGPSPNSITKKAVFTAKDNKFNDTNFYFSDATGFGSLLFRTVIYENNKKLLEESVLGFHAYAVGDLIIKNNDIYRSRRGAQYYPVRIEKCSKVEFSRNTIKGDERGTPGAECYFSTITNLLISDNTLLDTVRETAFSVNGSNVTFDNNYVNKLGVTLMSHSGLTGYRSRTSFPLTTRPANAEKGTQIYDAAISKPIYFNGIIWTDSTGTAV